MCFANILFIVSGKVYTVIGKRRGSVYEAIGMDEKEKIYLVQAKIPVLESEGFANEIRKNTSGQANPSLKFSHYEVGFNEWNVGSFISIASPTVLSDSIN